MQTNPKRAPNKQQNNDFDNTDTNPAQTQSPTPPYPTPPEENQATSGPHRADAASSPAAASSSSKPGSSKTRSWQKVEQGLMEIRRIAESHDDSQSRAIASTAEAAIIELLVDPPQHCLRHLARTLLSRGSRGGETCWPYAMVAPHVAALICWFSTLEQGNIAAHVQLPPVLTPLREILDGILAGTPGGPQTWARLVAVAEALEALLKGTFWLTLPMSLPSVKGGQTPPFSTRRGCQNGTSRWRPCEACCNKFANGPATCYLQFNKRTLFGGSRLQLRKKQWVELGIGNLTNGGTESDTMVWGTWQGLPAAHLGNVRIDAPTAPQWKQM